MSHMSTGNPPSRDVTLTGELSGPNSVTIGVNPLNLPSRTVAVSRPAFSPALLNGLALWLDAADASTITLDSSNNVSQWRGLKTGGRAMRRDENGVAVPGQSFRLPLSHLGAKGVPAEVIDAAGVTVAPVIYSLEMVEFMVYAANYHARLAEIVRQLAEWHDQEIEDIGVIVADAVELWDEMRKDGE